MTQDAEPKKEPVVELLPHQPKEKDFAQDFEPQASNIDLLKKDLDVDCIHLPLLKSLTHKFLQQLTELTKQEDSPEKLAALSNRLFLEAVAEVRERAARAGRDLLFINSY